MEIVNLSPEELSMIVNNNEFIGNGSYGLVVKYNEDYLLKFNYKDFIDEFEVAHNRIQLNRLGNISRTIEKRKEINQFLYGDLDSSRLKMIKLAMSKQPSITTLANKFVIINNH